LISLDDIKTLPTLNLKNVYDVQSSITGESLMQRLQTNAKTFVTLHELKFHTVEISTLQVVRQYKPYLPALQTFEMHLQCPAAGAFLGNHAVMENTFLSRVHPYIEKGSESALLPFRGKSNSLVENIYVTINSLILIKKDESSIVGSCLEKSLAQKLVDNSNDKKTVALLHCGTELTFPDAMRQMKTFVSIWSAFTNLPEALKGSRLQNFSTNQKCNDEIIAALRGKFLEKKV